MRKSIDNAALGNWGPDPAMMPYLGIDAMGIPPFRVLVTEDNLPSIREALRSATYVRPAPH